ncbi:MAG TPA: NAD-dependent epimerase/dehydratase family protein [Desulfomonilaceae bacterium]|nr:NAD-dependent epimerase/dehydratase family protein [Desulfomonilaceae bacterium]
MASILVTGSAGFIGFFVAKALLTTGNTVVGIDNFNPYYAPQLKRARWEILAHEKNFRAVEGDLADRKTVERLFSKYAPETVCHLAAQAGVRYSLRNPHAYQESNLQGFVNIMEAARLQAVNRFVYASSSSVYGGNTKMPYSEDDPVNTPVSLYAATKRANELMAYTYTHLWDLQTIGLRFFTVYGPWGRPDMAYWSFLEAILHDETIRVFNHGRNRRDFTYIDDVVQGVEAALFSPAMGRFEIINLGHHEPVELMDFIETLEELSGKKAMKDMVAAQPGDVVATYADIEKARRLLGFSPTTSLKDGLQHFVKWYAEHPELTSRVREFRQISKTGI